jgi:hypothetical protein
MAQKVLSLLASTKAQILTQKVLSLLALVVQRYKYWRRSCLRQLAVKNEKLEASMSLFVVIWCYPSSQSRFRWWYSFSYEDREYDNCVLITNSSAHNHGIFLLGMSGAPQRLLPSADHVTSSRARVAQHPQACERGTCIPSRKLRWCRVHVPTNASVTTALPKSRVHNTMKCEHEHCINTSAT